MGTGSLDALVTVFKDCFLAASFGRKAVGAPPPPSTPALDDITAAQGTIRMHVGRYGYHANGRLSPQKLEALRKRQRSGELCREKQTALHNISNQGEHRAVGVLVAGNMRPRHNVV